MKMILVTVAVLMAGTATAVADSSDMRHNGQDKELHGLGVGGNVSPAGGSGFGVTYQLPDFHIDGILEISNGEPSEIDVAGRFWYRVHQTRRADLSVGGGLGIELLSSDIGVRQTNIGIDGGVKMRVFLAANCAIHGQAGLRIYIPNIGDTRVTLNGNLVNEFGFTYFFQ